jgi:CYTH domain-containing protein
MSVERFGTREPYMKYLKYARIERERRFLVERLPPEIDPGDYVRLHDLFVAKTQLRIRVVRRPDGGWVTTKLGQKIADPDAPDDAQRRRMTTIYLTEDEGKVFDALDGLRATKRRYKVAEHGRTFSIDVWESPPEARGVILAEVEASSAEELASVDVPAWALREVTDDPRYSAFEVASASRGGSQRWTPRA